MAEKNLPKNLTENRKEIDQIDQELLNLIHERSKLVINAGKIKKKSGDKTFYRPDREERLIKNLQKKNKSSIPGEIQKLHFELSLNFLLLIVYEQTLFYLHQYIFLAAGFR